MIREPDHRCYNLPQEFGVSTRGGQALQRSSAFPSTMDGKDNKHNGLALLFDSHLSLWTNIGIAMGRDFVIA